MNVIKYKELILVPEEHRILANKKDLKLSIKEYLILELFIKNPYRLYRDDEIFNECWPENSESMLKTVSVHICNIRKQLKKHTKYPYIRNVIGVGYSLDISELDFHSLEF